MDILTFLEKIIDSLVWPAVVVTALYLFRGSLNALIDSITNATFRWKKGDITVRLNTVREILKKAPEKALPKEVPNLVPSSPEQVIDLSWRQLETTATSSLSAVPSQFPPLRLANMLVERKVLDEHQAEAFYRLYEIRNDALDARGGIVTDVSSSAAFSSIANSLVDEIKKKGA